MIFEAIKRHILSLRGHFGRFRKGSFLPDSGQIIPENQPLLSQGAQRLAQSFIFLDLTKIIAFDDVREWERVTGLE